MYLVFTALAPVLIACGAGLEDRHENSPPPEWIPRRNGAIGFLGMQFTLTLVAGLLYALIISDGSEAPPSNALPSLPPGISLVFDRSPTPAQPALPVTTAVLRLIASGFLSWAPCRESVAADSRVGCVVSGSRYDHGSMGRTEIVRDSRPWGVGRTGPGIQLGTGGILP